MYCHLDDLALEGDEYSAPHCSRFTPRKEPVHILQEAGRQWGQYAWHEKSHPHQDLILRLSSLNEVAILTTLFQQDRVCSKFHIFLVSLLTLILRLSRMGTVWFYTSTSNKRAARPKLYTKSLTWDLKLMYSRFTLVRISINL